MKRYYVSGRFNASEDARVARRILAIANALYGMNCDAAARSAGMDRQKLRDWVLRYNAYGIDGLVDRWNGGRPPIFSAKEPKSRPNSSRNRARRA